MTLGTRLWGAFAAMGLLAAVPPAVGHADVQADVLTQEARWLTAITAGDVATVQSILAPEFKHVTSEGQLLDRQQEIIGTVPQPFVMNPSEEIVDLAGDTAVVHGVNTVTQDGAVLARERFTDVFVLRDGTWLALSAQETAL